MHSERLLSREEFVAEAMRRKAVGYARCRVG